METNQHFGLYIRSYQGSNTQVMVWNDILGRLRTILEMLRKITRPVGPCVTQKMQTRKKQERVFHYPILMQAADSSCVKLLEFCN